MAAITVSFNKKESVSSMPEDSSDGVIYISELSESIEIIEVNTFKYVRRFVGEYIVLTLICIIV